MDADGEDEALSELAGMIGATVHLVDAVEKMFDEAPGDVPALEATESVVRLAISAIRDVALERGMSRHQLASVLSGTARKLR